MHLRHFATHQRRLFGMLTASAMLLTSCLDEATTSSNTDTPTFDNAPSTEQINAAYTESLDDSQIAADLAYLAWIANHDYVAMSLADSLGEKSYRSDNKGCYPTSLQIDSSFADQATSVHIHIGRTKNGNPFEYCTDNFNSVDEYYSALSGVTTSTATTITSDSLILQSEQSSTTTYVDSSYSFKGPAQMLIRYALPAPASIMASLEMSYQSGKNTSINLKGQYWFFDGRYQCSFNSMNISDSEELVCDITHNGVVVGALREDGDDHETFLDLDGNPIVPKLP